MSNTQGKPLVLTILEYFPEDRFKPSAGIYAAAEFKFWERAIIQRTVAQLADTHQVFRSNAGEIVVDYRLLEKDPDTAFRNATYRLTALGAQKRDELRHALPQLALPQ